MKRTQNLRYLAIEKITPSNTNPRKTFDQKQHEDLTENIRLHGVLQPVLVRPMDGIDQEYFELVAGERRYRAARDAGLKEIPVNVRSLTDAEAMEIQVIENLQRSELHPLEEADGYQSLISQHHYTVEDLAAKVGKSRAYIYGRLKFSELPEAMKKALRKDEITPSVALLIARIPDKKLQKKAADEILNYHSGPMSFRDALEHIKSEYMLLIKDAPFDVKDEMLCPEAGACMDCPKRTGKDKELFSDIKKDDLCTDPICFEKKAKLSEESKLQKFKDFGYSILDRSKVEKLFKYGMFRSDKYLDMAESIPGVSGKPLNEVLRQCLSAKDGSLPAKDIFVFIDRTTGEPREIILKTTVEAILQQSKTPAAKKHLKVLTADREESREPALSPEKIAEEKAVAQKIVSNIRSEFAGKVSDFVQVDAWPFLISSVLTYGFHTRTWFELKGLEFPESGDEGEILSAVLGVLKTKNPYNCAAMFAELTILTNFLNPDRCLDWNGELSDELIGLAKLYGVDVDSLRIEMTHGAVESLEPEDEVSEEGNKKQKKSKRKS